MVDVCEWVGEWVGGSSGRVGRGGVVGVSAAAAK